MKKENEKTKGKKKHVILKGIGIFIVAIFALCIIFPGSEEEGESNRYRMMRKHSRFQGRKARRKKIWIKQLQGIIELHPHSVY